MQGRDLLNLARQIVKGGTEAHWRCAVGRVYYALMLHANLSIQRCGDSLALLDAIDADPARRSTAIVAIRKAFP